LQFTSSETIDSFSILERLHVGYCNTLIISWAIKLDSKPVFSGAFDLSWVCFHDVCLRLVEDKQFLALDAKAESYLSQRLFKRRWTQCRSSYYCRSSSRIIVENCIQGIILPNILCVYVSFFNETDNNTSTTSKWLIEWASDLIHIFIMKHILTHCLRSTVFLLIN